MEFDLEGGDASYEPPVLPARAAATTTARRHASRSRQRRTKTDNPIDKSHRYDAASADPIEAAAEAYVSKVGRAKQQPRRQAAAAVADYAQIASTAMADRDLRRRLYQAHHDEKASEAQALVRRLRGESNQRKAQQQAAAERASDGLFLELGALEKARLTHQQTEVEQRSAARQQRVSHVSHKQAEIAARLAELQQRARNLVGSAASRDRSINVVASWKAVRCGASSAAELEAPATAPGLHPLPSLSCHSAPSDHNDFADSPAIDAAVDSFLFRTGAAAAAVDRHDSTVARYRSPSGVSSARTRRLPPLAASTVASAAAAAVGAVGPYPTTAAGTSAPRSASDPLLRTHSSPAAGPGLSQQPLSRYCPSSAGAGSAIRSGVGGLDDYAAGWSTATPSSAKRGLPPLSGSAGSSSRASRTSFSGPADDFIGKQHLPSPAHLGPIGNRHKIGAASTTGAAGASFGSSGGADSFGLELEVAGSLPSMSDRSVFLPRTLQLHPWQTPAAMKGVRERQKAVAEAQQRLREMEEATARLVEEEGRMRTQAQASARRRQRLERESASAGGSAGSSGSNSSGNAGSPMELRQSSSSSSSCRAGRFRSPSRGATANNTVSKNSSSATGHSTTTQNLLSPDGFPPFRDSYAPLEPADVPSPLHHATPELPSHSSFREISAGSSNSQGGDVSADISSMARGDGTERNLGDDLDDGCSDGGHDTGSADAADAYVPSPSDLDSLVVCGSNDTTSRGGSSSAADVSSSFSSVAPSRPLPSAERRDSPPPPPPAAAAAAVRPAAEVAVINSSHDDTTKRSTPADPRTGEAIPASSEEGSIAALTAALQPAVSDNVFRVSRVSLQLLRQSTAWIALVSSACDASADAAASEEIGAATLLHSAPPAEATSTSEQTAIPSQQPQAQQPQPGQREGAGIGGADDGVVDQTATVVIGDGTSIAAANTTAHSAAATAIQALVHGAAARSAVQAQRAQQRLQLSGEFPGVSDVEDSASGAVEGDADGATHSAVAHPTADDEQRLTVAANAMTGEDTAHSSAAGSVGDDESRSTTTVQLAVNDDRAQQHVTESVSDDSITGAAVGEAADCDAIPDDDDGEEQEEGRSEVFSITNDELAQHMAAVRIQALARGCAARRIVDDLRLVQASERFHRHHHQDEQQQLPLFDARLQQLQPDEDAESSDDQPDQPTFSAPVDLLSLFTDASSADHETQEGWWGEQQDPDLDAAAVDAASLAEVDDTDAFEDSLTS